MSASERRKGATGERELAALLRKAGLDAKRTAPMEAAGEDKGDVEDSQGNRWQVKRRARVGIYGWLRGFDRLAIRADREEWLVVMTLDEYLDICGVR